MKSRFAIFLAILVLAGAVFAPDAFCDTQTWSFDTGVGVNRSAPALGPDGTLYVASRSGYLYSLDPATGTQNWKYPVGSINNANMAVGSDGTIYVLYSSARLYAINPDGTEKWRAAVPYSYGGVSIGPDGTLYVAGITSGSTGGLAAIKTDGTQAWLFTEPECSLNFSTPAVGEDGTIYAVDGKGTLFALDPSGAEKWRIANNSPIDYMTPAVGEDGTVYYATKSTLYAVNPEDQSFVWTYEMSDLNAEFNFAGAPVVSASGTVYIAYYWPGTGGGGILGFDTNGNRIYRCNKVTALGISLGDVWGVPLLTRSGQLIFGAGSRVLSVSQTQQDVFSYVFEHPDADEEDGRFWYTSPVMDDQGRYFLCSQDGKVWAFSTSPGDALEDSAWPMRSRDVRHTACMAEENHAPVLAFDKASPQDIAVGENLTVTVTGTDPDAGDLVTLSASDLPAGATFNPGAAANPATGTFAFTPTADQEGQNFTPQFNATDDRIPPMGASDTFTVSVLPNHAPALAFDPAPPVELAPGDPLTVDITAGDPDAGDTVTLSVENLPAGAQFEQTPGNPATGTFTFTPGDDQACQTFTPAFTATDDGAPQKTDTDDFSVEVTGCGPANVPPELTPIGNKGVTVGEELTFTATATDANEGQTLAWEILNLPAGADFSDQVFAWTPAQGQEGDFEVTIQVCDDGLPQGCDEETFTISVGPGQNVESPTGTGDIHVGLPGEDAGVAIEDMATHTPDELGFEVPEGAVFPDGLVSFRITGLAPGATVNIVLTLPNAYANAQYYLVTDNGYEVFEGAQFNGNQVTLTKTDGGAGDLDGVENGEIQDPGGPAVVTGTQAAAAATYGGSDSGSDCFIRALR